MKRNTNSTTLMKPVEHTSTMPAWLDNSGPETDIVVSTRVRLARNLEGRQFPQKASLPERKGIFEYITSQLKAIKEYDAFTVVNFKEITNVKQRLFVERRLASPDLLSVEGDRGVIAGDRNRIAIMINEEDHLRLQCLNSGYRPEEIWRVVDTMDTRIGEHIRFAFDKQRGFLTSCPTNSGTGMRVSFLMHLPGLVLTKAIDQVLQGAEQLGITTRGFFGEHSDVVGSFFQLSNYATLGVQEEEFLENTTGAVQKIITHERAARKTVFEQARAEISDKIMRSLGILRHAVMLEINEFINLASALRLGIHYDVVPSLSIQQINYLMLTVLPAHLQEKLGRQLEDREMKIERASIVKTFLNGN
ncbi:MAG: ATP--guanido phosphotransferase [Chitinivibrionales bacterium]|nr:ATP--guanido phosphotransferase [Chitinivibrionales bacterium]